MSGRLTISRSILTSLDAVHGQSLLPRPILVRVRLQLVFFCRILSRSHDEIVVRSPSDTIESRSEYLCFCQATKAINAKDGTMSEPDSNHSTSQESAPLDSASTLSVADQEHLAQFDSMRHLLRDRIRSVAERLYHVGCYVTGRPGSSKTVTILDELASLGSAWTMRNSRMSAAG